MNFEEALG